MFSSFFLLFSLNLLIFSVISTSYSIKMTDETENVPKTEQEVPNDPESEKEVKEDAKEEVKVRFSWVFYLKYL